MLFSYQSKKYFVCPERNSVFDRVPDNLLKNKNYVHSTNSRSMP